MIDNAFGRRIKEARKQKGLTQAELADNCRLDIRTIQRMEAGEVTPRLYTMRIINEALGSAFRHNGADESGNGEIAALRETFQKRKIIRILTASAAVILMIAAVVLTDSNWALLGIPKRVWAPFFYLIMFAHIIGIALTWRCPGCNGLLGDVFNTRYCPKCGLKFYETKHREG